MIIFSIFPYFFLLLTLIVNAQDSLPIDVHVIDSTQIISSEKEKLNSITWHQMFTNIPDDYYSFGKYHTNFENTREIFGVVSLTGLLTLVDHEAWDFTDKLSTKNPFVRDTKEKLLYLGDGKFSLIVAGLFSIYGLAANDQKSYKTSSNLIEALLATGILVQVLKRSFGRESPAVNSTGSGNWDLFPSIKKYQNNQSKYYAFPSGHIATLTATLTVIANNYPEETWIKPVSYAAIGLVGISLVSKGWHWYSDFPLGIYLGYTLGNIVAPTKKTVEQSNGKSTNNELSILPIIHPQNLGIQLLYKF